MKTIIGAFILLASASFAAAQKTTDNCVACHTVFEGTPIGDPATNFPQDVHAQVGLSCHSCHGGDPSASDKEESMSPAKGYIGKPSFADVPNFCGRCHSSAEYMRQFNPSLRVDQVVEYRTSVHGQRSAKGDTQVATCISCHSVHGIRRVSDPASPVYPLNVPDTCGHCHADAQRMEPYGIPHSQVADYKASVHGIGLLEKKDLSAATCNDCHGNHGATPPGASSVANVCGTCHGSQRTLFLSSPHGDAFLAMELNDCVTCHGNHGIRPPDETLLIGDQSACGQCHEDDVGTQAAQSVAAQITELNAKIDAARTILQGAEQQGMEVSRPIFDLHSAHEQVVRARNLVHGLDIEEIGTAVTEGVQIADKSYEAGVKAFDELAFRRRGLYVALAIIGLVIIALWALIREVDSRRMTEEKQ